METAALPACDIRFEEEPHRYLLRGVAIPSVTQIMEPMSLMLYNGIPADVMYEAANRGTRVHEQVSNFVKYGIEETDEDTKPYFQAFQKFQAEYEPHWAESEYRTYHKTLRYAGTLDLIGFVEPDDGTGFDVVDLKCTSAYHPVMLATQIAGYAEALKSHGVLIRRRYGLQLLRDGNFRFEQVEDGYKTFLHCMAIYNAMAAERRP